MWWGKVRVRVIARVFDEAAAVVAASARQLRHGRMVGAAAMTVAHDEGARSLQRVRANFGLLVRVRVVNKVRWWSRRRRLGI